MNVNYITSFIAVLVLCLIAYVGTGILGLEAIFGIGIPYLAVLVLLGGVIYRMMSWAKSPVPFRIPTTCGQQKSLSWIEPNSIDNPTTKIGVVIRMALEILLFRSLFRNTRMSMQDTETGPKLVYNGEKVLWISAIAFHYCFLIVLVRHLRFFLEPVPGVIKAVEAVDAFMRIELVNKVVNIGLPGFYITGLILLLAVFILLLRRILDARIRYISLASDYFPLFLILGIAFTGILMRYFFKVDIVTIKELAMGLVTLHPSIPEGVNALFYIHLFLVSTLFIYFPFSKLMHAGGIFLSPTRNLTTDTRARRHINPWNYPVKVHTYEEYEDDFREKMIEAGLPVEKE